MSDFVWPTRLPRLWDSPGKNTGVGCHCFLQCMKVKSESEVTQLCPTLCDPTDGSPPGSPIPRIFQARVLEWGAIAFSVPPKYLSLKTVVQTCLFMMFVLSGISYVWLLVTPWTVAHQGPLSMGFSRQEHWSGLPCLPLREFNSTYI